MNDLIIRQAVTADALPIIDIHSRAIRALCVDDYSQEQLDAWIGKRTPQHLASRILTRPFFVADLNGKVVGYAAYFPPKAELASIYVDPDYARQGIASQLMDVLVASARRMGLTALWLDASLTAVPFYHAVGFENVRETIHEFQGVPLECIRMKIDL
jgi:putative acetyltransferase